MRTAAVIPARDEAATVASVVAVARASPLVDEVIVANSQSTDETAAPAEAAGARVVHLERPGKGEAMIAAVATTDAAVLVFLDADLIGLRVHHVDRLVHTVRHGGAIMACGLFDRGPWLNQLSLHVGPILTGERALRRELFDSLRPDEIAGYRVEAALNARAGQSGEPVAAFVCPGMSHTPKQDKARTQTAGWLAKGRMLGTAYSTVARCAWEQRAHGLSSPDVGPRMAHEPGA